MLLVKLGCSGEGYEMKPGQSSLELRLRQTVNHKFGIHDKEADDTADNYCFW